MPTDIRSETPGGRKPSCFTWLLPLLAFVAVYLSQFKWPNTPVWNPHSDFVQWLGNAQRMLEGDVMYRDFFHYLPPGTEVFYMACLKIFGVHAWLPNGAVVLLGMIQVSLVFYIARRVMSDFPAALAAVLYLGLGYRMLDPVHHWFSTSLLLAGIAVVITDRSTKRIVAAGILFGLASFVTTPRGLLGTVGLGAFLLIEAWGRDDWRKILRTQLLLGVSFAGTYGLVVAPFAFAAGFDKFYWCTVTYILHYHALDERYAIMQGMLPDWNTPRGVMIYGALLVYPCYFIFSRFRPEIRRTEIHASISLLCFIGLFQIGGVAHYANLFRISTVIAPAFIIVVWFLTQAGRLGDIAVKLVWVAVCGALFVRAEHLQAQKTFDFEAPVGRVTFVDEGQLKPYQWLLAHTERKEYVFDGNAPNPYFLLDLRNPANMYYVAPYLSTRPEQVTELVGLLEKKKVRFVWWTVGRLSPGKDDPLPPLRHYLRDHFHVAATYPDGPYHDTLEVWERNF